MAMHFRSIVELHNHSESQRVQKSLDGLQIERLSGKLKGVLFYLDGNRVTGVNDRRRSSGCTVAVATHLACLLRLRIAG